MKFNIAFYCESIPFTDKTIRLETSLGGSESALIGMANALAQRGHTVTAFTRIDNPGHRGEYAGVGWYDSYDDMPSLCQSIGYDIFISLRMAHVFTRPFINAKYKVIWVEDELLQPDNFLSQIWSVDEIFYVSKWQRNHYESRLPETVKPLAFVTKNGIDLSRIDKAIKDVEKKPNQLIYISRPERGLEPLLQIWPQVQARIPGAMLKVCRYYSMYEPNPNVKAICDWADAAIERTDGVEYLGNLGKDELYRAIAESALMVYPGVPAFNETSCIAALEAQACRTPLICSNRGGLTETLFNDAGAKIDGDAFSQAYQAEFVNAVDYALTNPDDYRAAQEAGRKWVEKRYEFSKIAVEWETHFKDFFTIRYDKAHERIYLNLMHFDDVVAAGHVASAFGFADEHRETVERRDATETPEAYHQHSISPELDRRTPRFDAVLEFLPPCEPKRILDFACGNGAMAGLLAERFPNAEVTLIDYSQELIEIAKKHFYKCNLPTPEARVGSLETLIEGEPSFDLIFCGEFLEHCTDPETVVETLQSHLSDTGWLVWTVPHGALAELTDYIGMYGHKVHFEYNTVNELFGVNPTAEFALFHTDEQSPRGGRFGHWLIKHQKGKIGQIDWEKKVKLTRPYNLLSVCMITKNEEKNIIRCIDSVRTIADEIWVADMGSTDATPQLVKAYGSCRHMHAQVLDLPPICPDVPPNTPPPGDFSWARNQSISHAQGDWILWIDADEELLGAHALRKYLDSHIFDGFAIRQNHLQLDAPVHYDTPVRLFRNGKGFQFYGHIHEHAMISLNEPIEPALELTESQITHYGYITESRRRHKGENRNMALLALDRKAHPGRHLGQVLLAREYINLINWDRQDKIVTVDDNGVLPLGATTQRGYAQAVLQIWDKHSPEWRANLKRICWPVYQAAMEYLGGFTAIEVVIDGKVERLFYRDIWEIERFKQRFELDNTTKKSVEG